ncbi:hypothetical protein [Leptolyngbya sp. FACHB-16]|nr:hypothetical protein [Leptolyngbya sp. FACHB-16]
MPGNITPAAIALAIKQLIFAISLDQQKGKLLREAPLFKIA